MFNKKGDNAAKRRAEDGKKPIVASILRTLFRPLFLVSFLLGSLFAHFILGPMIFR